MKCMMEWTFAVSDSEGAGRPVWHWRLTAVLCVAVALVSARYLLGLGPVPPIIDANPFRHPWLVIHVAGAAAALLLSPIQLLAGVRARWPRVHRYSGRLYVVGCLSGAVSGLLLAFGATTGVITTLGFGSLAVVWFYVTSMGWHAATQRQFASHRAWMLRSFALTFGAVLLRLYLPIAAALPFSFENSYRAISFLAWVPNLLVVEWYLRKGSMLRTSART